jgi:hypothetical protein
MPTVKYRAYDARLRPRRTRLEVPGWAGLQAPRADGSHEYPWHCVPFSEAARAGLELCYPYDEELRVSTRGGVLVFELGTGEILQPGGEGPPFRSFGREYFTFRSSIDLQPEPGWAIKIETHPRFYSDTSGEAPIAVPAILHAWWPMVNFLVFKSPAEGATHVFRPGEPFVLITVVPAEQSVEVAPMAAEEAAERELMSRRIYASRSTLAQGTHWVSSTNTAFDGTYRLLSGAARKAAAQARAGQIPAGQARAGQPAAAAAARSARSSADYGGDGGDEARAAAAARAPESAQQPAADHGDDGGDGRGRPAGRH